MRPSLRHDPAATLPRPCGDAWLLSLLSRNSRTAYMRRHGSPRTRAAFRDNVPTIRYEDLLPWLELIRRGQADVLFAGRPVAYERTGGSTGGAKLIPYSAEGLGDFQRAVVPWLLRTLQAHRITGRMYFALSPATRQPERIGGVPVGLPDGAYLGAAASLVAEASAVPLEVASITDAARWRVETLRHLEAASDLELISVWSPTFLLRLLEGVSDPESWWPRLKVLSCWASGASQPFAAALAARLPQAQLQPKGLLSTECVVTVPEENDRPVLTAHGFFEFERNGRLHLADELSRGSVYEVVVTTASGLYRYRTGDLVRCDGSGGSDLPILEFVGRGAFSCDLVGEKLAEPFVARCLEQVAGFRFLAPEPDGSGYLLAAEAAAEVDAEAIEWRLCDNPQYAHARKLGQLKPLRVLKVDNLFDRYVQLQLDQGVRLADVKPVALRSERSWGERLG